MAPSNRKSPKTNVPPAIERARARGNPLHFVLRASGGFRSTDTYEEHDRILQDLGSVWIGKWGAAVGPWAVEIAREQLAAGVPTFLYLRIDPRTAYKGVLKEMSGPGLAPDMKRVPEYYRDERCGLWFLVDRWAPLDEVEVDRLRNYTEQEARPVYSRQGGLFFVTLPR